MNEPLQPGHHLDADQLAAFVEGALTERERQESLAHMAVCEKCRDIAFLMQPEMAPEPAPAAEPHLPFWRRFTPLVYASGLGVCATVLIVFAWMHQGPPPPPKSDVAHSVSALVPQTQANTTPELSAAKPVSKENAKKASSAFTAVRRSAEQVPTAPPAAAPPKTEATDAVAVATQNRATQLVMLTPGAAVRSPLNGRQMRNLPLNGRAASRLAAPAAARPVSPEQLFPPPNGQLALRIEHGQSVAGAEAKVAGVVLDLTGATISGATVTLRQPNMPLRQTKTDNTGNFTLASVPAGKYKLKIAASGFQTVTQPLTLHANDVALLTSQVPVGSANTIAAASESAPTLTAKSTSIGLTPLKAPLPGDAQLTDTIRQGNRVLALDSIGRVYLSTNNGKHWKAIKPLWSGKVSQIEAAKHGQGFSLTTDANAVWSSDDGKHWQK